MTLLLLLNACASLVLGVYALHEGLLLWLSLRRPRIRGQARSPSPHGAAVREAPAVTVQLPLYNERFVAERIIAAACALNYPAGRLQIQVLDDSTDSTVARVRAAVEAARAAGHDITLIRRPTRDGYKAGALAHALPSASGELIAIFDADFVPPPDFLTRLLLEDDRPFDDPTLGFIQTRWAYLNRDASALTRAQAIMLDMHFVIEQPARSGQGLLMNFNGSGGVWRRAAIEDAGGWQADTLSEDLDLSYRAELRGWRGRYVADQAAPSELPLDILAFKLQQARWARGSGRCIRKLLPLIWKSQTSVVRKVLGSLHVSGYVIQPMIVLLALTSPLLALSAAGSPLGALAGLIGLLPLASMAAAHRAQGRPFGRFLRDLPAVTTVGIGLSVSNSAALLAGLFGRASGAFARTPKHGEAAPAGAWRYALRVTRSTAVELALGGALWLAAGLLAGHGDGLAAFGAALYAAGYSTVGALSLRVGATRRLPAARTESSSGSGARVA
ncbi:MAG: glycosyltransferase [Thermoflexales bacterium]|nr:glycosyltransferase [Thermoflexales bacterium]